MLAVALLAALPVCASASLSLPFVLDGGDPPCAAAVAEAQESRRLIRETAITAGLVGFAQALDLGSTAWADSRYACRDTPPGQVCLVEWNSLTPTSVGLIAAKVGVTILATGVSYLADRLGHQTWAKVLRWIGVAAGVIPAAVNVYNGLKVEQSR